MIPSRPPRTRLAAAGSRAVPILVLGLLAAAPFGGEIARAVQGVKLLVPGTEFFRLRYAEDLVSVNDKCPVRKIPLGAAMPPVLVNGNAVGFC